MKPAFLDCHICYGFSALYRARIDFSLLGGKLVMSIWKIALNRKIRKNIKEYAWKKLDLICKIQYD